MEAAGEKVGRLQRDWNCQPGSLAIWLTLRANIALLGGPADNDFTGAAWAFTIAGISPVGISLPLSTHDFNGDGKSDILSRRSAGDVPERWPVNGASILQTAVSGNVPANLVGSRAARLQWRRLRRHSLARYSRRMSADGR